MCFSFSHTTACHTERTTNWYGRLIDIAKKGSFRNLGGGVASFAIMGWLWHYPRSQNLLNGISNATSQVSPAVGILIDIACGAGYTLPTAFFILSAVCGLCGIALFFVTPAKAEMLREMGRVLDRDAAALDNSTFVGYWMIRHLFKSFAGVLALYREHNIYFMLFNGFLVTSMMGMFSMASVYDEWFGRDVSTELNTFLGAAMSLVGITCCPIAGILMDRIGFLRTYVITLVLILAMTVTMPIRSVDAQKVCIVAFAVCIATYQTAMAKYCLLFAPPQMLGSMYGGMLTGTGCIFLLISGVAPLVVSAKYEEVQSAVFGGISFLVGLRVLACFLRPYGIPAVPPKDQYDFPPRAPTVEAVVQPSGKAQPAVPLLE